MATQASGSPRVIYFDLETTGYRGCNKYSTKHRIIQFAAMEPDTKRSFSEYVCPELRILPRSTAFHHITDEMVKDADKLPFVWQRFVKEFKLASGEVVLVAHNCHSFDRVVLLKELERLDIHPRTLPNVRFGDSLLYFRHLAPPALRTAIEKSTHAKSKFNLANLYQHFVGTAIPNAHDAGADVNALATVCQAVALDWTQFPWLPGMETGSHLWYFPVPSEDVDIVALHGIGPARRNALQRTLIVDGNSNRKSKLTINTLRSALGTDPTQVEAFLRAKVKFDDDALILELLAYICRSSPLKLLANGFPFHRNYWGFLDIRLVASQVQQKAAKTIQELVEETLYDETLKKELLRIGNNQRTFRRYSYRLN